MASEKDKPAPSIGEELGKKSLRQVSEFLESGKIETGNIDNNEELQLLKGADFKEFTIYGRYMNLVRWANAAFTSGHNELIKLTRAIDALLHLANEALVGESFNAFVCDLPEIMTGKEFIETRKAAREEYFTKDGKDVKLSAYDVLISAVEYYIEQLDKEPGAANPMAVVKEWYSQETVKSDYVLNNWHRAHGHGYFTREGKRSEIMTREQFEAFREKEEGGELIDILNNYIEGGSPNFEKNLEDDPGSIRHVEWHDITGRASALTKWEATQSLAKLYNDAPDLQDLENEFPMAIQAAVKQTAKDYRIDISEIPVEKWREPFMTRRELYKAGLPRIRFVGDFAYVCKQRRGIAIVAGSWDTGIRGTFKRPRPDLYREQTLEGYIPERGAARVENITRQTQQLLESYHFINGLNCAMELIAQTHDVPGFLALTIPLDGVAGLMTGVTNTVEQLISIVQSLPDNDHLRNKKLRAIKDHFLMPRLEEITIPVRNIDKARRMIKNLSAFEPEHLQDIKDLLFKRPTPQE